MKKAKKRSAYVRILLAINHYLIFFLIVAFVITCCMMLFISVMSYNLNITLTDENLNMAAKLTFINVVFLSLIFTVIDMLRRKLTIDRPVKRITEAAERMMQGDFSTRISLPRSYGADDRFRDIMICFNKMAEELSKTETLRTDFIANVSHELKTPLAVMKNYSTMLRAPGLTEEQREEYAKAISDTSGRLANLITNILRLNKLENQQVTLSSAVFDLGEQVCECLLSFENAWESKALEIETDIEDGILVNTDEEMMTLVWNNLFSNAIKFTDNGGKITLIIRSDGDFAEVSVSDTGCGISADVGAHMFDKFYQGDTSHATQGNGLGLALVKRVVDITGSDISVKSELGKGSTFTVRMRRKQNADT
ncbi:MAG: HAMP domain-containing histidine kinase [Clostridia bacterium]|nr:HAMP domain-containing histidine kinase [Clostridia bacterium]